jgi:hypothetical protein
MMAVSIFMMRSYSGEIALPVTKKYSSDDICRVSREHPKHQPCQGENLLVFHGLDIRLGRRRHAIRVPSARRRTALARGNGKPHQGSAGAALVRKLATRTRAIAFSFFDESE